MSSYVFDLEADGLLYEATKVHCGVFKDIETKKVYKFRPNQIEDMLTFMSKADRLIGHNVVQYDFPLLERLYGFEYKGQKVDTLLMSRAQNPKRRLPYNCPNKKAGPHSVEAWGYRVGRGKPEHHEWGEFSEAMLHRCSEDVEIQYLIYKALLKEAEGQDWDRAHRMNVNLFDILRRQEEYGWLVDRPYMEKCIKLLDHWTRKIDKALDPMLPYVVEINESKVGGEYKYVAKPFLKSGKYSRSVTTWMDKVGELPIAGPFSRVNFRKVNLNSDKEVKEFLLKEGWQPDEWNYKKDEKGRPIKDENGNLIKTSPKLSQDEDFIGVNSGMGRLMAKRVQVRHRKSQIEGWIKAIRPDGRISAKVAGIASTGRIRHNTIVNVPGPEAFFGKQMRKCFTCKKGFKIVGTDSAGCQNRMLAARVGDPAFTKTLIEGKKEDKTSIHWVNVRAMEKEGVHVSYKEAKNLNYAFMFGASDKKLGSIIGKGPEVGAKCRKAMLGVAPGFEKLVNDLTNEWRSNAKVRKVQTPYGIKKEYYDGWVRGLDGRPIFIESEHTVLVYMLQSDEAIMMACAYILLYKRALAKGWKFGKDWGFLIWYHDEFQAEVREDLAEEFARLAEKSIEDAGKFFKIRCPHKGESDIGNNWYETH